MRRIRPKLKASKLTRKSGAAGKRRPAAKASAAAKTSLYRQVARALRDEILRGERPVGDNLPAESELSARFAISRHTVRQALRQLRDEGLVASRQGSGTVVVRAASSSGYIQTVASIEELIPYAAENRYDVSASELVTCDTALARKLGCSRGDKWLRITGYRYPPERKVPICWTEVFIRPQFSGVMKLLSGRKGPIYTWIEELYGADFAEVQQTLRVRDMPKAIAPKFDVEVGSPAVEICRVYRLDSGTVAEIAFNIHPADRFTSSITLHRSAP
jgi:GntR family transcriptional regulator